MGHSEIAQSPCQRGDNGKKSIGSGGSGGGIIALKQIEITGQGAGVVHDV